ncbi:MAG: hypothetical protein A2275_09800 [Bacteroidetes bacterium RIFOXYA12_FULL_35_11]|nr:MAG: hypothetical protein A2X01_02120 [Bacteroidetes bacterium GWF2_35_48]OFY82346.1 MAG: hypothetical protein A2275_09800 [Bacteroidetes bacterium RIFOXYA12_FULL_35_11]OFY98726.1 MAG: hypothetical protein A2491_01880 [Bacteroidetes bacterium RIFOXYC12_FULL_35_7]HBX49608.1 hypothetical protein [Bacteroidales bacterium]
MIKNEKVTDLTYLIEMTGGKKHLILEIIYTFLEQIADEIKSMNDAISTANYATIKSYAHTMKSTVSVMGISIIIPVLKEMENLGAKAENIEKIKELKMEIDLICKQAILEIETIKLNYV